MSLAAILLLTLALLQMLLNYQKLTQSLPILKPTVTLAIISTLSWLVASLMNYEVWGAEEPVLDQFWYWAAVFGCCPLISVLGAKSPTARVWTWFIILPLIAVLGWPAVTVLFHQSELTPIEIQLPAFIGFVLVLVMGCGNYLGTRYGMATLLYGAGILISLWPLSNLFQADPQSNELWRLTGTSLVGLGILLAARQSKRPTGGDSAFDRLWFDFSDTFGIVWSMRIQERINQTAEQEGWSARLGHDGFHWDDQITPEQKRQTVNRLEHTLRWLLRRFVEPEWIDSKLNAAMKMTHSEGKSDQVEFDSKDSTESVPMK